MAPETEAVIARTCGGKRAYGARCARLVAQRRRQQGEHVSPYRCFHCGSWHIGHTPSYQGLLRIAGAIRDLHGNRPDGDRLVAVAAQQLGPEL